MTNVTLSIGKLALVVGRCRYVEHRLFEITGRASSSSPSDVLTVALSELSGAHGYRASLFEALLPVSVGLSSPSELSVAGAPALEEMLERLGALATAPLCGALFEVVYPAANSGFSRLDGLQSPASGRAFRRALLRAKFDLGLCLEEHVSDGEALDTSANEEINALIAVAGGLYGEHELLS